MRLCHKLSFSYSYICATRCHRPYLFQTLNSVRLKRFKISKVYTSRLQRYWNENIGVCGKDSTPFFKTLLNFSFLFNPSHSSESDFQKACQGFTVSHRLWHRFNFLFLDILLFSVSGSLLKIYDQALYLLPQILNSLINAMMSQVLWSLLKV